MGVCTFGQCQTMTVFWVIILISKTDFLLWEGLKGYSMCGWEVVNIPEGD